MASSAQPGGRQNSLTFSSVYQSELAPLSVISVPLAATLGPGELCSNTDSEHRVTCEQLFAQYAYVGLCFVDQSFQSSAGLVAGVRRLSDSVNCLAGFQKSRSEQNLHDSTSVASSSDSLTQSAGPKFKWMNILRRKSKKKSPPSAEISRENSEKFKNLAVIFVSLDFDMQSYCASAAQASGHYLLPLDCINLRSRLVRACGAVRSVPTLSIIDTTSMKVVCPNARRYVMGQSQAGAAVEAEAGQAAAQNGHAAEIDGAIEKFPWPAPSYKDILSSELNVIQLSTKEKRPIKDVIEAATSQCDENGMIALLFAANWCPPCRNFVRALTMAKRALPDDRLTVIFCSSDLNEDSFNKFAEQMPWFALPFGQRDVVNALAEAFNVTGIPSMVLLDKRLQLITATGKEEFFACADAIQEFPWLPRPVYELTEGTMALLRDAPSLVLFSDGTKEDIDFSSNLLHTVHTHITSWLLGTLPNMDTIAECDEGGTETTNGDSDPNACGIVNGDAEKTADRGRKVPAVRNPDVRFFYAGNDPICDELLQDLGLEDELTPLLVAIDAAAGVAHTCSATVVSPEICAQFAKRFLSGDSLVDMPTRYFRPAALLRCSRLATIPKDVMLKAINAQSPRAENNKH